MVLILSAAFLLALLQNSAVQSYLAKSGSAILSESLGIPIWIEKIRVKGYFNIGLYNVNIKDQQGEAMITAKEIIADIPLLQGFSDNIPINLIEIDSAFIRLKKYNEQENINIISAFNLESDTLLQETDTIIKDPIRFTLDHLIIKNTRFIYEDANAPENEDFGMDYAGLDISSIDAEMQDIEIYDDSIISNILHISAKEKCGIKLKHLEGLANVSSKGTYLKNAVLQTDRSIVHMDLGFNYFHWSAYLNFIEDVYINSDLKHSQLNLQDISYFAPAMMGMDNEIRIQGDVKGFVKNLKAKNVELSYGESTSFRGDAQLTGLPNIYETFINLKIKALSTDIEDIRSFKLNRGIQIASIPPEIEKFGKIRIKGRYTGFYNDFVSNADVYTELGKLYTNIQFQNNTEEGILYYHGDFKARNFDLGQFIDREDDFGQINFNLDVNGKGLKLDDIETKIKGRIDNMEFRDNPINTIFVDAFVEERQFKGTLHLSDNLINADFSGLIDFDTINPIFDFKADFESVRLAKLGLIDADQSASLSSHIHMNFAGAKVDDLEGYILVDSTEFFYVDNLYTMDSLHIFSIKDQLNSNNNQIKINSDYINGEINGVYSFENMVSSVEALFQNYIYNIEFVENDITQKIEEDFEFWFSIANSNDFLPLIDKSIKVSDSINISGYFKNLDKKLFIQTTAGEVEFNELKATGLGVEIKTSARRAMASVYMDEFSFKQPNENDTLRLGLDLLNLKMKVEDNIGSFNISWDNKNQKPKNNGLVRGRFKYLDLNKYKIKLDTLDVIVNDSVWNSVGPASVLIDSTAIHLDSLQFESENQSILIYGVLAETMDQGFVAHFKNFDVGAFNMLTASAGIRVNGQLTGDFQLIDPYRSVGFLTDLKLNNFHLNGELLGNAEIKSTWNSDQSIFVNLNLSKLGNKGEYKPLFVEGFYYPNDIEDQLDFDVSLHDLSINFLNPFLKSFVANLEGSATGEIRLKGSLKEPDLKGQLDLARTQFRIIYLNTLYSMSGTLNLDNKMLGFNQVNLYDTVGNVAQLIGGLTHNRLRNFGVDLRVKPKNFVALNTRLGMNELFYGKAVVTGDVLIKGPFDNIFLDIDAKSNRGTDLNIPINTKLGVSENNFIVFVNKEDTIANKKEQNFVPQLASFSLNMDLIVTPDAKIQISLPSQLGEIQATGFGDLNMNLSRTGNFRMSGDYRVSDGLFFFKIRNLLNRKFTLNEGGTISWTGDPYSGTLGMSANYQLKTSLNSLGLDQDSSYRNRVPVDCIIGLSGPIMDPNIKFRFEFPNATEEVKQYVFTKIDTTNSSEMSQQMLSLLIFNSFSFNNAAGDNSLANSVTGSSMQIVANQLSNWLSQISKDVDIGINYRPGDQLTNEEVEVALSTQLWDERVTIDGNFGYQNLQDNPSSNTSNIVGDLNVEVKITKDGRLRLKAFNRTNTVDLLDNTSPYTQGVGIFYRKEFNNLKELFTNQKKKENEKKEAEHKKSKARSNEEEDHNKSSTI